MSDAEFSRAVQLYSFRPITAPCICPCGKVIDPAAMHLLHCSNISYAPMHDLVKYRTAYKIRSLINDAAAPLSVRIEDPVHHHYPLKDLSAAEGEVRYADIVVALTDTSQFEIIIADVVTALPWDFNATLSHNAALDGKAREKRAKYYKYDIPPLLFFPIPISRTGQLSEDAMSFCAKIASRLGDSPKACDILVATISSAAIIGAARTCNAALRRLQLASLANAPLSFVNSFQSPLCAFDNRSLYSANSHASGFCPPPPLPRAARDSQSLFSCLSDILRGGESAASEHSMGRERLGAFRPLVSAVENFVA